jgi:hypothetical protein
MEKAYYYSLTIGDIRVHEMSTTLSQALRSLTVTRRSVPGDMRWGLVLYRFGSGDVRAA